MNKRLHDATEGKDDEVGYAEEEAKVNHIIEDVIERVSVHGCKVSEN